MTKRILLSAVGGLPSVSIIKHLQENNLFVVGYDVNPHSVGAEFVDEFHESPPIEKIEEYFRFLMSLEFDFFFPWIDEELALLSKNQQLVSELSGKVIMSSAATIEVCLDKSKSIEYCQRHSISIPCLTTVAPAFIRPFFGRGSKGAKAVYSQAELDSINDSNFIKQKIILGTEYTVDALFLGDVSFFSPRSRDIASNVSTTSTVCLDEEIIEFCKDLVRNMDLFGPVNIQLFRDHSDGSLLFVELNPRIAGTSILSIKAGLSLILDTINYLEGKSLISNVIHDGLQMRRYYDEKYIFRS